eukprot:TRINITY_DN29592_c0_g1_i1.p1 TRINITY_DN29592_c0_g1~~TRINITY_DN29592_c0_g1_i1.p1  ORF type:complete len:542 (-),score=92.51 TRINITY_DN29592_c0_g1_i1:217-1653(-)
MAAVGTLGSTERAAFRLLLRLCRRADRHPEELVALRARPAETFNRELGKVVRTPAVDYPLAEAALVEAAGGSEFAHPGGNAARAVRRHKRSLSALGLKYLPEADELIRRIEEASAVLASAAAAPDPSPPPRPKTASASPRQAWRWEQPGAATGDLRGLWTAAKEDEEHRSFPKLQLPWDDGCNSTWQHLAPIRFPEASKQLPVDAPKEEDEEATPLAALTSMRRFAPSDSSEPEVGDMLVAHPLALLNQPSLDHTVVLVTGVNHVARHVRGVVLGKRDRVSNLEVMIGRRCDRQDRERLLSCRALLSLPLYWGGDLHERGLVSNLTWLHAYGSLVPGSAAVAPGVWQGGELEALSSAIEASSASKPLARPILGYVGWSTEELQSDLSRGVWVRTRATSPHEAVDVCIARQSGWKAILDAVGLSSLADFPRGGPGDKKLRELACKWGCFSLTGVQPAPSNSSSQDRSILRMRREDLFRS